MEAPGVGVFGAGFLKVAVGGEDGFEALGCHAIPGERQVSEQDFLWSWRKLVEIVAGDDTEVASACAAAGAEEVRLVGTVGSAHDDFAISVDGEDVDGGKPVDGQPVEAREDAVAPAGDVAASAHGVARPCGEGETVPLVEVGVDLAELGTCADAVLIAAVCRVGVGQEAQIEENAVGIVADEIFIAVAAGANRRAKTGADDPLEGIG